MEKNTGEAMLAEFNFFFQRSTFWNNPELIKTSWNISTVPFSTQYTLAYLISTSL